MARLPQPGSDSGTWGDILNEYLSQTLKADGSLKDNSVTNSAIADNAVTAATIQDGSITEAQLNGAVQTKLNASGGTSAWNDITGKPAVIAAGVDQAAARTVIGAGTSNLVIGTTSTTAKAGDYTPTKEDIGLTNVDNTSDATKNSTTATLTNKTLVNPKINAVQDTNNNQLVEFVTIPGAVNQVYITNQSAGNNPTIGVDGNDTDIGLAIAPKGNGRVNVFGNSPTIAAAGGYNGGNLDLNLRSQGTGVVQANDVPVVTTAGGATLTNKTISGESNTLSDIDITSLATTGAPSASTYLRGDGSWQPLGASGTSAVGSLSGFSLGLPGERSYSRSIEIGSARGAADAPTGAKNNVLAEVWDQPGMLKRIWMATAGTWSPVDFGIRGGRIRIYVDDESAPAVNETLGDFFFVPNNEGVYATPRVGRVVRSDGQTSSYRYLHMPFQKYLRVEIENTTAGAQIFYGAADFSTISDFADIGSQQSNYKIAMTREVSQPVRTPLTICDIAGSGQVESVMASFAGSEDDEGVLEGNLEVFIDGEAMPSWSSSGMEDAFNGGWYNVPIGGYPAGRPGLTDQSPERHTLYRFFVNDPVFFTSQLKVVLWAGQHQQANPESATVELSGSVGYWLNTPTTPDYITVDTIAAPLFHDDFDYPAGAIPAPWAQDGTRIPMTASGSSFLATTAGVGSPQDVRVVRNNLGLPANYWVETRVRITDTIADNQEASLILLGSSPDAYFGSAIHIQLRRFQQHNWAVAARDDFDTPGFTNIASGRDLTNQWVRLAAKVVGTKVTAYYSLNDAPAAWVSFASWTTAKNGPSVGVGTWEAHAEFDSLTVRPLKSVTN